MHIVHVTHRSWPMVGGSERYVQEIARRQVEEGHRVTVIATNAGALSALWDSRGRLIDGTVPSVYQGVLLRRLPLRHLPLGRVTFPALRWLTWALSNLSGRAALPLVRFSPWVPGLAQALAEERADLLFAWNITLEGLTAAVAREAQRRRVPWVAVPVLHLARLRFYTMPHQLDLLRQAQAVLAQTPSERDFLLQRGFAPHQVHIVSPGVSLEEAETANGSRFRRKYDVAGPLVVSLGVLCAEKGTIHLLAAAQKLWREGRPLTLALLGPQEEEVRRALVRLPKSQRRFCISPGEVSEMDKWDALDGADVVALPSRTESFGIVFLEAWARGKPVIGASAGAVPDVVEDGTDGLLVRFGDVPALAEALCHLLDNPQRAAVMGRRGREKVARLYTWERQVSRLRQVIAPLLTEEKG